MEMAHFPMNWYEKLMKNTIKTIFIPLSSDFIEYLTSDGLILPKGSRVQSLGRDELSDDEELTPVTDSNIIEAPTFIELNLAINNAIQAHGGKVFIKFHTKAPIDTAWINGGSLACHTSGDIYMLLKSSTKVFQLPNYLSFVSGDRMFGKSSS